MVLEILMAYYSVIFLYSEDFEKFSFILSVYVVDVALWIKSSIFIFKQEEVNKLIDFFDSESAQPMTEIEKSLYF